MMLVEEGLIGLDDEGQHPHPGPGKTSAFYASGMPSLLTDAPPSFI